MNRTADSLPTDLKAAHAIILAQREALLAAQAQAAAAESEAKYRALLIEKLKFTIAKRHAQFGQSSERSAALEQLELQLADLEEDASQAAAEHFREFALCGDDEARRDALRQPSGSRSSRMDGADRLCKSQRSERSHLRSAITSAVQVPSL